MTDIIERLRNESRREPHEPIWKDAIGEIEALRETVRMNACESRASTHADDCWSWGPGHYKCAMREIKALQAERDALREALEAMLEIHGVTQHYADTHIEIPQSWVEVSELARAALSGESNAS